jgi:hypothetical protein
LIQVKEKGHMEIHAPTENFLKSSGLFKGVVSSLRLDSFRTSAFVGLRRDKQAEHYNKNSPSECSGSAGVSPAKRISNGPAGRRRSQAGKE